MQLPDGELLCSVNAVGVKAGRPVYSCGLYTVFTVKGTGVQKLRKVQAGPVRDSEAGAWLARPHGWPFRQVSGLRNRMTVAELSRLHPLMAQFGTPPDAPASAPTSHERRLVMGDTPVVLDVIPREPDANPVDPSDTL